MTGTDPLDYLFSLEQFGIKFGLDNVRTLLRAMGQPQLAFASVHIAGTNGKGSVTAMVDSVLRCAGVRTGRYTSPHLVNLTERFAVNGVAVPVADLRRVVGDIREVVHALQASGALDVHPTFFEVTTVAAFELFRRAGVELAVCEVGLGGRLDATNVLAPIVTAITTIAKDHERYLGDTLAAIAREKAGIIKARVPVVVGRLGPESLAVVTEIARAVGAPLINADADSELQTLTNGAAPLTIRLRTPGHTYERLTVGLDGEHQAANAVVAIRILEELETRGWPVTMAAVVEGLTEVRWPGRLERVVRPNGTELLLDAAHNPAGAAVLAAHLRQTAAPHPLVLAIMRDKDVDGIVQALAPVVSMIVTTRASHPRSLEPEVLADIVGRLSPGLPIATGATASLALDEAWRHDRSIVVAGSIFLLGDVMSSLEARDRLQ